jgi:uncharacterized protein (DUF58 family)
MSETASPPARPFGGLRSVALLAGALVAAGLGFDSLSILVCGTALAAFTGGAAAWVGLAARAVRVERLPGPSRMQEDERYPLRVRIRRGPLPLPPATLADPLLPDPVPVGSNPPAVISVAAPAPRRGRHLLAPSTLVLTDPVGLTTRAIGTSREEELLVLPRIEPVRLAGSSPAHEKAWLDGLGTGGDAAGIESGAVDLEMDGLRPYRAGSPASRIHWRTVARSGEMYERRFVAGADAAPLIALDLSEPAGEEEVECAVRAAASLCFHLSRRGGCAILIADRPTPSLVDPRLRSWPDVHARLALVEAGSPAPRPRHAQGRIAPFWVTASAAADASRAAARRLPGSFVVSPAPLDGGRVAFTVAGCSAQRSAGVARRVAA